MESRIMPVFFKRIIAASCSALGFLLVCQPATAQQPDHLVKIQFDPTAATARIPDDFIGFGYESSAVAQPEFFTGKNARMIRLYTNLGPHGLIRIGGNVSDHTRYIPTGTTAAKTEREVTIINQQNLADLGDFARATGWQVMWGLNLGTGTKEEAVDEAIAVDRTFGKSLQSLEIGNEVDLMRKYSNNFDAYHAAYVEYKTAIRAKLPGAVFSGPDVAGNVGFFEKFVATESADMKLATYHYYRGGARNPNATMERLLAHDDGFDSRLEQLHRLSAAAHLNYRINEVNSFSGGGKEGVSDTFGSALWCLDYMFNLAAHGCAGVNMETDVNQLGFISSYSPIVHDAAGVCSARPDYYGMLAFAMARHGELMKTTVNKDDINLTAYATKDDTGNICLTTINKDRARDATIEYALPVGIKTAEAYRLSGPAMDAKADISFAGARVADDGSWTPAAPEAVPVTGGVARLNVPHASAVVVKFRQQ